MIKFLCPSGHELSADERLAGKPGKCPKCQVRFLIPEAAEDDEPEFEPASSEDDDAPRPPPLPVGRDSSVEQARSAPAPAAPETFAFLCPNGHKLSGPLSLQGKAGQCPHCQERFLIPVLDAADPVDEEQETSAPPPVTTSQPSVAAFSPDDVDDIPEGVAIPEEDAFPDEEVIPSGSALRNANGFASAWNDLWPLRVSGEPLEVYFAWGGAELVHRYAAHPTDPSLVLLATREDDGRHTIIAARWSSILRIAVRRCEKLPEAWFGA